jgi:hypothetical protein
VLYVLAALHAVLDCSGAALRGTAQGIRAGACNKIMTWRSDSGPLPPASDVHVALSSNFWTDEVTAYTWRERAVRPVGAGWVAGAR